MKTKLISLTWRGSASVDPRFSAAMLSWSVADICTRDTHDKLSVGIENGQLEAYNCDFEQQFAHHLRFIVGVCRVTARHAYTGKAKYADFAFIPNAVSSGAFPKSTGSSSAAAGEEPLMSIIGPNHGFVYLLKDPRDPLLHIHLFEGECVEEMTELLHQMRDPTQPLLGGSVGSIPSSFIAPNSAQTTLRRATAATNGHQLQGSGSGSAINLRHGTHSTPASNLKFAECARTAQHDGSPSVVSRSGGRMSGSKSYTAGLNHSAGTVHTKSGTMAASQAAPQPQLLDISPNNTQFFEVMYVGKIKVSHKRVPFTFIDDALPKFKAYDAQKIKAAAAASRRNSNASSNGTEEPPAAAAASTSAAAAPTPDQAADPTEATASNNEANKSGEQPSSEEDSAAGADEPQFEEKIINTRLSEENKENSMPMAKKLLLRGQSQVVLPVQFEAPPKLRDRSASIGAIPVVEQNRTMVFLIGKSDMRLISPDRKQVLLYKDFKDVASCAQGHRNADHFGIICREPHNTDGYIGYVFKCQSDAVADDIVGSISQAFHTCSEQKQRERAQIFSCEHCPMLWYHKLCSDIEGLSDKKTQTLIFRRVELLSEEEQGVIMAKYYGAEEMADHGMAEQNQFMMMLLRAHCESRQQRHVHDTAENRSEFLNQYLGGSTIFMKAKRSLTSSFDHLLKRKNSKDDVNLAAAAAAAANQSGDFTRKTESERSDSSSGTGGGGGAQATAPAVARPRAASMATIGTPFGRQSAAAEPLKSPMMDIFIKVGNSPKDSTHANAGRSTNAANGDATDAHSGSWRQEILHRVVTPSKKHDSRVDSAAQFMSPRRTVLKASAGRALAGSTDSLSSAGRREAAAAAAAGPKRTAAELRQLWRTAIKQTILLRRMERENARLQERHNEHELKKIKLDYDEIIGCPKQAADRWDTLIERPEANGGGSGRISCKQDPRQLLQAIRAGVPRGKRGEVWSYLAAQFSMNVAPVDVKLFPNFNTPYKVLLKSLTEHQHAIFIDLGRTFPNHMYYKAALGIGQLSLFNILKAYSILDPELGYCQGLGFICGVLLLHCDEEEAFNLLKHLMFRRQMRTKYLPDMRQFQLQLYQLSRLIRDHCPELYAWLDQNEVPPTLYAAPWILTVFSSQFPLGFVTRVFDLLFLESPEVIFKVAIALLDVHQEHLLLRDGFEEIMDYLKNVVPKMDAATLDAVQKKIFHMDIRQQLSEYQVEYNVLQEEISTTNHHLETLKRTRENNKHLEQQLQFAQSSIAQLEATRTTQQSQIQTLHSQVQSLEISVQTLGSFIAQLSERHPQIDLPGDIRRICQQVISDSIAAQQRKKLPIFVERKIGKSMSVNSQLGFPLKVLEEMNESPGSPTKATLVHPAGSVAGSEPLAGGGARAKTPFFESTYAKIRQQQQQRPQRLLDSGVSLPPQTAQSLAANGNNGQGSVSTTPADIRLPDYVERAIDAMTSSPRLLDSGISTPVSPPLSISTSSTAQSPAISPAAPVRKQLLQLHQQQQPPASASIVVPASSIVPESPAPSFDSSTAGHAQHPLSNCEDVHFQFNGTTTQLKSIRPVHHVTVAAKAATGGGGVADGKTGRS